MQELLSLPNPHLPKFTNSKLLQHKCHPILINTAYETPVTLDPKNLISIPPILFPFHKLLIPSQDIDLRYQVSNKLSCTLLHLTV